MQAVVIKAIISPVLALYLFLKHLATKEALNRETIIIVTSIKKTFEDIGIDKKHKTIASQTAKTMHIKKVEDDFLKCPGYLEIKQ